MQSIDDKLIANIHGRGRGCVFSSADFTSLGDSKTIKKALDRIVKIGNINRISNSIYWYPKVDKQSKSGVIRPSYYDIAKAIARHKNLKIAPSGDQALYILGLSDQVPESFVYFTDGITKSFPIKGGKEIFFSHIEPRKIAFSNETAMLITFALNEIGADNVTAEQEKTIVALLQNVKKKAVLADSLLMPDWIRCIVEGAYEKLL